MTSTKPKKKGRPSLYTEVLAARIFRRLAEGESLRAICRDVAMPDKATVLRWLADKAKIDFRDQYAHARERQADALFDEALEIADDASGDWAVDKDGKKALDHENVQRSRLRVDTRSASYSAAAQIRQALLKACRQRAEQNRWALPPLLRDS